LLLQKASQFSTKHYFHLPTWSYLWLWTSHKTGTQFQNWVKLLLQKARHFLLCISTNCLQRSYLWHRTSHQGRYTCSGLGRASASFQEARGSTDPTNFVTV
jgi:hypothetical protein